MLTLLYAILGNASATGGLTDIHTSSASHGEGSSDITICINDVTLESTEDAKHTSSTRGTCHNDAVNVHTLTVGFIDNNSDCDDMSIEYQKRQKRRSSWCPEEGRKVEEKKEQMRLLNVFCRRY